MYKLGTGDCFALKFYDGNKITFRMLIDCGTWSAEEDFLRERIVDLKKFLGKEIDLMVVTHEHKDHVYGFRVCEEEFNKNFKVKETWMAWSENEEDNLFKDWKERFGNKKKKAFGMAAKQLRAALDANEFEAELANNFGFKGQLQAREDFVNALEDFAELHFALDEEKVYSGPLKGMAAAKRLAKKGKLKFKEPGEIIKGIGELTDVNFYVLGPPRDEKLVKKLKGRKGKGETYDHNKDLLQFSSLESALLNPEELPFDPSYEEFEGSNQRKYNAVGEEWRKIDHDWRFNAGLLALRMNSYTNNLSLVLAMEFQGSKKVMLFPGDAEWGSWKSWHEVFGDETDENDVPLMESLLNRTVFYKVAHHLSHNGTAKELGLEMMTSPDLVAMASVDYNKISSRWTGTMPNRAILNELLKKTRGKFMIMNEDHKEMFADKDKTKTVSQRVEEAREQMPEAESDQFFEDYKNEDYYIEYILRI